MTKNTASQIQPTFFDSQGLRQVFELLTKRGYEIIGPLRRGNAIVYDKLEDIGQLPKGWTDEQKPASYRIRAEAHEKYFNYTVGQNSLKTFLFPPSIELWKANRGQNGDHQITVAQKNIPKIAFIGVRACELAALSIHEKVLAGGNYCDTDFVERRKNAFIVAVNCTKAGGTCFCRSMGTGPKAQSDYDIALTEIVSGSNHGFVADIGSESGKEILTEIDCRAASAEELNNANEAITAAESMMGIQLETKNLPELLAANIENQYWDKIGERCLACSNCTMVCPTCFCTSIMDSTDLAGTSASRSRRWDSCFRLDYSYIHGGSIRQSIKSRYRQWLMHKLSTWVEQFGTFGCVGCGRCVTWCPVGINIADEAKTLINSGKAIGSLIKAEG